MQTAIARAVAGENLTREQARHTMEQILAGEATPSQIAGLAVALRMKGETMDEIAGMAEAMRALVPPLHAKRAPLLDTCGTGGDNAGTFNISTTVAIVVASCGVAVAKHGNRAMSSRTGGADVLEALGVRIDLTPVDAARSIDTLGITFLFAPNYHGALRHAVGPRRELGIRTVFNALGPLTNPAGATRQLLGVYADRLVRIHAEVLRSLGSERALVVHGRDGMDELTVFEKNHVAALENGQIREFEIDPAQFGLAHTDRSGVQGGSATENATRVRAILAGERGAGRDIVLLNAAAALQVAGAAPDIGAGLERARAAIDGGDATRKLADMAAFRA
ncbi:MAG TPA: anthranilate phosphoribosyltransferase [Candidatus Acidoferrales bacterium]|nr:anthranilate phosphoribosyltransferase [Candidatus Acidoferrales bacterium]